MTADETRTLARNRLQAIHDKPETAHDHIANAVQCLIGAEAAFERLNLLDNATGDATELRNAICNARVRVFKAFVLLSANAETR